MFNILLNQDGSLKKMIRECINEIHSGTKKIYYTSSGILSSKSKIYRLKSRSRIPF